MSQTSHGVGFRRPAIGVGVCSIRQRRWQRRLDKFGGVPSIAGHPDESFHLEKIGNRWWLVTPEGHGVFIRAVSKVDVADYGGSGGFLSYDGVYLQTAVQQGKRGPRRCRRTCTPPPRARWRATWSTPRPQSP